MTKNYDNICFVFLRSVYDCNISRRINQVSDCVYLWGGSSYYRQFFCRLTLYYTIEKYFLSTFFQTFLISSIHGVTEAISYIRMCVRVAMRGIPLYLYSRNTARRHVYMYACVYTIAFKSWRFHLELGSVAAWLWLLYIYFIK